MLRTTGRLKDLFQYLWNGGLEPSRADPRALRQRRTFAGTVATLLPVLIILMVTNAMTGAGQDNPVIGAVAVCLIGLVVVQAVFSCPVLVGHVGVFAYWAGVTTLMLDSGLGQVGWAWALGIPLVANLLVDRWAGLVWAAVVAVTYWSFAVLQANGVAFPSASPDFLNPYLVAIDGTLMLGLFSIAPLAFRAAQDGAEKRLMLSIEALAQEVEERRKAEAAAVQAERGKTAFLAAMSHELRTPLNGLLGAVQLLSDRNDNDPGSLELLTVMRNSGDLLLDLINNILDLSRLDADSLQLEQQTVDLPNLLRGVLSPFELQARGSAVSVRADLDPDLPHFVTADPTRLRQIFLNLLGNACKFTDSGSVVLAARVCSGGVVFEVKDTGIGIPQSALGTLFEPYVQAEAGTARRYGGNGLGLAIVKRLVDAMQGQLDLVSEPGAGSTFTVVLPLSTVPAPGEVAEVKPQAQASMTVLVVDDNEVNRLVLKSMLNQLGHSVTEAVDGQQAVDLVKHRPPDLVFMDLSMPILDGYGAIQAIRALPGPAARTRIVALTAHVLTEERDRVLQAGADGFLTKPLRRDELVRALSENGGDAWSGPDDRAAGRATG